MMHSMFLLALAFGHNRWIWNKETIGLFAPRWIKLSQLEHLEWSNAECYLSDIICLFYSINHLFLFFFLVGSAWGVLVVSFFGGGGWMTSYSFTSSFTSSFTISLSAVFFFFLLLLDSSAFSSGALMADLLPYFFPLTTVGDLSP